MPAEVGSPEHESTAALKRLEQQAAAVAHELNNILTVGGAFKLFFERRSVGPEHELPLEPGAYVVFVIDCHAAAELAPQPEVISLKEQLAGQVSLLTDLLASMNGGLAVVPSDVGATRFELYLHAASSLPVSARDAHTGVVAAESTPVRNARSWFSWTMIQTSASRSNDYSASATWKRGWPRALYTHFGSWVSDTWTPS